MKTMDRKDWRGRVVAAAMALCTGCASSQALGPEDFVEASRIPEEVATAQAAAAPGTAELLAGDDPDLAEAVRIFQETGRAPIVRKPGFVRFPYGEQQPILTCKPLRVCDIQLEAGETVLSIAVGDSERWIASKMESGPAEGRVAHVIVKPTEFDISTNLVITTDRRVYHLGLISSMEEEGDYLRSVRFYYPAETVQRWASAEELARESARLAQEREVAQLPLVSPDQLNFAYRIRGDRVPWRPVQAFDDGTRVFIQMSDAMTATEAPALFVETGEEGETLVNYRVRGRFYVVDKLFA
jgi:type IV secretion system protein VirB9